MKFFLMTEGGEQFVDILLHAKRSALILHPCQQFRHRRPFINEQTDEAARLGQRQGLGQQLRRLVLIAMRMERDRLQNHRLEPFILPALFFRLPTPGLQCRQRLDRIPLGQ